MGMDQFTDVSHEGGLSRIGSSFGAAIFGVVLFLASFPLLWWNEGRAVDRMRDLEEGQAAAVSVQSDRVDAGNEGKLVHTTGTATTDEELADEALGVKAVGLRLRRSVEMFQWEEEKHTKTRKKVGAAAARRPPTPTKRNGPMSSSAAPTSANPRGTRTRRACRCSRSGGMRPR